MEHLHRVAVHEAELDENLPDRAPVRFLAAERGVELRAGDRAAFDEQLAERRLVRAIGNLLGHGEAL